MKRTLNCMNKNEQSPVDFHGASIIDESGQEIPITENMLQQTFEALIHAWEQAQQKQPLAHKQ